MATCLALTADDLEKSARLLVIVREAGDIAMRYFRPGDHTEAAVTWKGDGSPVTEADYAVNLHLEVAVRALWPEAAWLSEESADDPARLAAERVIIVDPIDGTRGFARGDRHWCVAVALIERGRPIIGIVHAPALGETYVARVGAGTTLNGRPIVVADHETLQPGMRVSAQAALAQAMRVSGVDLDYRPKIASLALRIALVASGQYDCCLASRDSNDWDIAAADLVLQEAGGLLAGLDGKPVTYNHGNPRHGVLTATARRLQPAFLRAIEQAGTLRR